MLGDIGLVILLLSFFLMIIFIATLALRDILKEFKDIRFKILSKVIYVGLMLGIGLIVLSVIIDLLWV